MTHSLTMLSLPKNNCNQSLHWLKINWTIEYKLLSLTYEILITSQPDYRHNLISVQSKCKNNFSSVVTLARPFVSSSLRVTNRSFRYASPYLWNWLPSSLCQPHSVHSSPGSPHPAHITNHHSHHFARFSLDSPNREKVHSMSRLNAVVLWKKNRTLQFWATFLVCSITYVLLVLRHSRLARKRAKVLARFATAQNYNSRNFWLKM